MFRAAEIPKRLMPAALAFGHIRGVFAEGSKPAVAGALLAVLDTGSEVRFGAVITGLAVTGLTHRQA